MNKFHYGNRQHKRRLLSVLASGIGLALALLLMTALPGRAARMATASVELSPGYEQTGYAGETISFTHTVTNGVAITDVFGIAATSAGWSIQIVDASGVVTMPLELGPGLSHTLAVRVSIPFEVISGTVATFLITATSQTSSTVFAATQDTVTIWPKLSVVYLPLIMVGWPPVPATPVLNPINGNAYSWGDHTVIWSAANRAESYTLEDDDNFGFTSPTVVYSGPNTFWPGYNVSYGKHYYRVRAENNWGPSLWSDVQSISVLNYMPQKATADTAVLSNLPTANFGTSHTMIVGYDIWAAPPWNRARSFVQFDISMIPSDTIITGAKMNVFLYTAHDKPFWARPLNIRRITGAWNEMTLTWETQLGVSEIAASVPITNGSWGWHTIDVTNLVRGWVTGQYLNYGVALDGVTAPNDPGWWSFYTREEPNYEPTLQVSYPGQPFPSIRNVSAASER